MDYSRRCSSLDIASLQQPSTKETSLENQRRKKQWFEQVSYLELSENFKRNPWHDMMLLNVLKVIPPFI